MDTVSEEKTAPEVQKGPALEYSKPALDKLAAKRLANKQRKKKAHLRKIARSNTNG
jgi:hypothetical protein